MTSPAQFPDLTFWTTTNNFNLVDNTDMHYSTSELPSTRTSLSSHPPSLVDGDATRFYSSRAQRPSKGSTPEDNRLAYQLPSPLADEILVDLTAVEKERRREQNRVAQRAFRERKESKLKQLEKRISELKSDQRSLEKKYNNLRIAHLRLQSGLRILLDASGTFDGEEEDTSSIAAES